MTQHQKPGAYDSNPEVHNALIQLVKEHYQASDYKLEIALIRKITSSNYREEASEFSHPVSSLSSAYQVQDVTFGRPMQKETPLAQAFLEYAIGCQALRHQIFRRRHILATQRWSDQTL